MCSAIAFASQPWEVSVVVFPRDAKMFTERETPKPLIANLCILEVLCLSFEEWAGLLAISDILANVAFTFDKSETITHCGNLLLFAP
jgi:hypothetical protein